ncbi:MAG: hypothetical protein P0111_02865 [Nitrospira sp.]|nr:hypothetical protein [Nitrospira sp.]
MIQHKRLGRHERFLKWVFTLGDPGPLAPLSRDGLEKVREELSKMLQEQIGDYELGDQKAEMAYKYLSGAITKLRSGMPIDVYGFRVKFAETGNLVCRFSRRNEIHEAALLLALMEGQYPIRKCRRKSCGSLFLFEHGKKKYCSDKCSGLVRIHRLRRTPWLD